MFKKNEELYWLGDLTVENMYYIDWGWFDEMVLEEYNDGLLAFFGH